jgi:hypothetical protein
LGGDGRRVSVRLSERSRAESSPCLLRGRGSVERLSLPESEGSPYIWVVAWGRRVGRPI